MIRDAGDLSGERLADFYREILQPAFRAEELVPLDRFVSSLLDHGGTAHGLVATDDEDRLVGGLIAEWYAPCRVALGSYVVVRPDLRGRGIGTTLLRSALEDLGRRLEPLLFLGEVEDPRQYHDQTYGDPVARLRLYSALGARILDAPYLQPSLTEGASRVRGLFLMAFPPSAIAGRTRLTDEQARAATCFIKAYFASSEGSVGDDPDLRNLLAALSAPDGVPLVDPDDVLRELSHGPRRADHP